MKKLKYCTAEITRAEISMKSGILSGSIFSDSTIQASGQEIAARFNFEDNSTAEDGKFFNHEWE